MKHKFHEPQDDRTFWCSKCNQSGNHRLFRKYVADLHAGLTTPRLCNECQPRHIPLDYERRNRHLKLIGFNSYKHYLASEMWQTIRGMVLSRSSGLCEICGRPATDVHHNSYEVDVLIGRDILPLIALCRHHHESAEFDGERKRELPEVRETLASKGVAVSPLIRKPVPTCLQPDYRTPAEIREQDRQEKKRARYARQREIRSASCRQ